MVEEDDRYPEFEVKELVMVRIGKELEKQVLPKKGASVTLMKGRLYRSYIDLDVKDKGTILLD